MLEGMSWPVFVAMLITCQSLSSAAMGYPEASVEPGPCSMHRGVCCVDPGRFIDVMCPGPDTQISSLPFCFELSCVLPPSPTI